MAKKSFTRPSVREGAWGTDDGMDHCPGSRGKEGKQGIEAALLRGIEVGKVSVEDAEPELWPVLPKVRHLAFVQAAWSSRRSRRRSGGGGWEPRRLDGVGRGCGRCPHKLGKPLRRERVDLRVVRRLGGAILVILASLFLLGLKLTPSSLLVPGGMSSSRRESEPIRSPTAGSTAAAEATPAARTEAGTD